MQDQSASRAQASLHPWPTAETYEGSSDSVIIRVRRMLLNAAREHQAGAPVPWLDESYDHGRIRPLAYRIPGNVKWHEVDPISPPNYRFEA